MAPSSSTPPSPNPSRSRRPLSLVEAAAWSIGVKLVLALTVMIAERARTGAQTDWATLGGAIVLAYSAIILLMLRIYEPETRVRDVLSVRFVSVPGTLLAAIAGGSVAPALVWLGDMLSKRYPSSAEEQELAERLFQLNTRTDRIACFLTLVIASPLCEELFYRGMLYGGIRRGRTVMFAMLGTTIFFVAGIGDFRGMPGLLVLGMLLAWLRARSGSIVPGAFAHIAYWAVPFAPVLLLGRDEEVYPRTWLLGGLAISGVATVLASLLFTRDARSLDGRIADG